MKNNDKLFIFTLLFSIAYVVFFNIFLEKYAVWSYSYIVFWFVPLFFQEIFPNSKFSKWLKK